MKGGRKPSQWNIFVTKVYHEGQAKDKNYSFKQAMSDASARKNEMTSSSTKKEEEKLEKLEDLEKELVDIDVIKWYIL